MRKRRAARRKPPLQFVQATDAVPTGLCLVELQRLRFADDLLLFGQHHAGIYMTGFAAQHQRLGERIGGFVGGETQRRLCQMLAQRGVERRHVAAPTRSMSRSKISPSAA